MSSDLEAILARNAATFAETLRDTRGSLAGLRNLQQRQREEAAQAQRFAESQAAAESRHQQSRMDKQRGILSGLGEKGLLTRKMEPFFRELPAGEFDVYMAVSDETKQQQQRREQRQTRELDISERRADIAAEANIPSNVRTILAAPSLDPGFSPEMQAAAMRRVVGNLGAGGTSFERFLNARVQQGRMTPEAANDALGAFLVMGETAANEGGITMRFSPEGQLEEFSQGGNKAEQRLFDAADNLDAISSALDAAVALRTGIIENRGLQGFSGSIRASLESVLGMSQSALGFLPVPIFEQTLRRGATRIARFLRDTNLSEADRALVQADADKIAELRELGAIPDSNAAVDAAITLLAYELAAATKGSTGGRLSVKTVQDFKQNTMNIRAKGFDPVAGKSAGMQQLDLLIGNLKRQQQRQEERIGQFERAGVGQPGLDMLRNIPGMESVLGRGQPTPAPRGGLGGLESSTRRRPSRDAEVIPIP